VHQLPTAPRLGAYGLTRCACPTANLKKPKKTAKNSQKPQATLGPEKTNN
jgi:hypothetical protein